MKTILVVEDELSIRSFICLNLRKKNYQVYEAESGEKAMELIHTNDIDVVLLDIMLPGMDGFTVCEEIRRSSTTVGIIMLTARTREEDKVKGLIQGADDYILKPFSMVELEARMISLIRRMDSLYNSKKNSNLVEKDHTEGNLPYYLEQKQKKMFIRNQEIKLTPTEFTILHFLIQNKGVVYSRDNLLDEIWGVDYVGDIKVVDVNIRRIRSKIEVDPSNPEFLLTAWGHGYMWKG